MTKNVGKVDSAARLVLGLAIIGAGVYFNSWWGLVEIIPLITGGTRVCPVYMPFKFSTCSKDEAK